MNNIKKKYEIPVIRILDDELDSSLMTGSDYQPTEPDRPERPDPDPWHPWHPWHPFYSSNSTTEDE